MPHQIAASSQRLAASPHHSAWVAASAGSGKTKVLTDRVLNLLLEGCAPERILCLTFTKAAAAEMEGRLRTRLGEWAILPDHELRESLKSLRESTVSPEILVRARTLFGLTLDTPGGLKIQTIHGFCQSLLKRFPLEAGLSPFFNVANDTERKSLIKQAFYTAIGDPSFQELVFRFSESTFEEINTFILQERVAFEEISSSVIPNLFGDFLGDEPLKQGQHNSVYIPEADLKKALPLLDQGSSTDQERGNALAQFLAASKEEREQRYGDYISIFLTQKGEARARLLTQKLAEAYPDLSKLLRDEAHRLEMWIERQKTLDVMRVSQAFADYSRAFLRAYADLKQSQSFLDYEDLILKTVALLKNPGCHWVLYKLDGGLDHILVDEAQDTSPAQWQVIRAIAEEFYANATEDSRNRTLFIVGDDKQSIYSFQGADPVVFTQMQKDLRDFAQNSGKVWRDIDLNVSFRSTPEILALVDAVFHDFPGHLAFRKDKPGHVEVWPLLQKEEESPLESWQPPVVQSPKESPQKRLAQIMAQTIQGWLLGKGPLPRPISPGDILILVRRRTAFVDTLIRTLKEHDVPVAGVDRLWLLEGIGVQDLLKIGEFLLLPEDDLTLATVLKGPLFNLPEEDLFKVAYDRGHKSLWQCLLTTPQFKDISAFLKDLLSRTDFLTPFELYSHILGPLGGRRKWQARLGAEVVDSLDEFLNLCLLFQEEKTPSLQGFISWISQEVIELKRDLEQSNQVRVMTVHGSKGLQAPIVFLPDTTQPPFDVPPFGFYNKSLIWLPSSDKDIPLTKAVKQELREAQFEEYRRLLYVALTRAEDALYVCGWEGSAQETWYSLIMEGMRKIAEPFEGGWRLSSVQQGVALSLKKEEKPDFLLPQWLQNPPLLETTPKLLRPSEEEKDDRFSPSDWGEFGTERGILIHKLLEILPGVEEGRREQTAMRYLENKRISRDIALEMIHCAQRVLKAYPDLFGADSQGEVAVMGHLGISLLSGQIDRLIVNEDHVLIVDFKTHGNIPKSLDDISSTYLKQMAIYQAALSQIYPERPILCGLLWTEEPRLDVLPESLLKKFMPLIDVKDAEDYNRKNLSYS